MDAEKKNVAWRLFRVAILEILRQKVHVIHPADPVPTEESRVFSLLLNGNTATITYVSRSAGCISRLDAESCLGTSFLKLLHPKDRNRFLIRYGSFLGKIRHEMGQVIRLAQDSMEDDDSYTLLAGSPWQKPVKFRAELVKVHSTGFRKENGKKLEGKTAVDSTQCAIFLHGTLVN